MQRFLLPLLLLALAALTACSVFEPEGNRNRQRRDLEAHRSAWAALQISDYSYTARMSCFCPPEDLHPVVLEVRSGSIVSVHHVETGVALSPSPIDGFAQYHTVEQLFDVVERALRGRAELEVQYDPVLHYPRYINTHIPRTLDSGFSHTAQDLVPLR